MAAEEAIEAIHMAARGGDLEGVARMLDEDPRLVSYTWGGGDPLLMRPVLRGHVGVVRLLLERGADVDAPDAYRSTALHHAAERGHEELVCILLSCGANPSRRSSEGQTPLMRASEYGRVAVVRMLLRSMGGHGLDMRHNRGYSALYYACLRGHADIVRALLLAGADHTIACNGGQTPLQVAQEGHQEQCDAVIQWWETKPQRADILHKARTLHDDSATRQQAPAAPVPAYLRPRVQGGSVMPIVEVVAIEQEQQEGGGKGEREEEKEEVPSLLNVRIQEEAMSAMLKFVVKDLGAELYIELLAGLHQ